MFFIKSSLSGEASPFFIACEIIRSRLLISPSSYSSCVRVEDFTGVFGASTFSTGFNAVGGVLLGILAAFVFEAGVFIGDVLFDESDVVCFFKDSPFLRNSINGALVLSTRCSSCVIVAITLSQSPCVGCLNKRILFGYQGVSSRSSIQRQSGGSGIMIHTGLPNAAAR